MNILLPAMFSSSLVFTRKRDGELCRCYLDCIFLLCGLSTISVHFCTLNTEYLTARVIMKRCLSFIVQLVFKLERKHHKGRGSILNALSQDTFVVGHYNLTGECKDEWRSIKSSNSSLSSRRCCLLVPSDSSKPTTRGWAGLNSQCSMGSKENRQVHSCQVTQRR